MATNLATLTFGILFDNFPEEISYSVSNTRTNDIVLESPSFDNDLWRRAFFTAPFEVEVGESYQLEIFDEYGDGLNAPDGFFGVYWGATIVEDEASILVFDDNFEEADRAYVFDTAAGPPNLDHVPVTVPVPDYVDECDDPNFEDRFDIQEPREILHPHFQHPDHVWPDTNAFCEQHSSYEGCVNEAREDCQWLFRPASPAKGTCRVDPIAACIQNGNCVCETSDFMGDADEAEVLFHAPISVTAGDISAYKDFVEYREMWKKPEEDDPNHPQRDEFFISRVDFTGRQLRYDFDPTSPITTEEETTILFKLHFLYMDVPLKGIVWNGQGIKLEIDSERNAIVVNDMEYVLPEPIKKWTCTAIAVTSTHLVIGRIRIALDSDSNRQNYLEDSIELGPFSGELFDVRVYKGTLSQADIENIGQRCAAATDPDAMRFMDIQRDAMLRNQCNTTTDDIHAGQGGDIPVDGMQSYGGGAFATLWVRPQMNKFGVLRDGLDDDFDEDMFFQHAKLQSYVWEKFYFENDMIAFVQPPYRHFDNEFEVPNASVDFWNNPCRYMHHFNTGWKYPIYGDDYNGGIEKWTVEEHGFSAEDTFDLWTIVNNQVALGTLHYFVHEGFHAFQGHLWDLYESYQSGWLVEGSAEFGLMSTFPAYSDLIVAAISVAPAYPLNLEEEGADRAEYFQSDTISLHDRIRGGHIYASWILWWFISEHVGLPHIIGVFFSMSRPELFMKTGELTSLRALLTAYGFDLGDVWMVCVAHMRTWDFPIWGNAIRSAEDADWKFLQEDLDLPMLLESRKTTVELNPKIGTGGAYLKGPQDQQPGPFGWNCISVKGVDAGSSVSIDLRWGDNMGFHKESMAPFLQIQENCDEDPRFYQGMVITHDESTGQRRYWKMKGKSPSTVNIEIPNEYTTIHILAMPTPPTDYVQTRYHDSEYQIVHVPSYSYSYRVIVNNDEAASRKQPTNPSERENGIIAFDSNTEWWPVRCTCLEKHAEDCWSPEIDGVLVDSTTPEGDSIIEEAPTPGPSSGTVSNAGQAIDEATATPGGDSITEEAPTPGPSSGDTVSNAGQAVEEVTSNSQRVILFPVISALIGCAVWHLSI